MASSSFTPRRVSHRKVGETIVLFTLAGILLFLSRWRRYGRCPRRPTGSEAPGAFVESNSQGRRQRGGRFRCRPCYRAQRGFGGARFRYAGLEKGPWLYPC